MGRAVGHQQPHELAQDQRQVLSFSFSPCLSISLSSAKQGLLQDPEVEVAAVNLSALSISPLYQSPAAAAAAAAEYHDGSELGDDRVSSAVG